MNVNIYKQDELVGIGKLPTIGKEEYDWNLNFNLPLPTTTFPRIEMTVTKDHGSTQFWVEVKLTKEGVTGLDLTSSNIFSFTYHPGIGSIRLYLRKGSQKSELVVARANMMEVAEF